MTNPTLSQNPDSREACEYHGTRDIHVATIHGPVYHVTMRTCEAPHGCDCEHCEHTCGTPISWEVRNPAGDILSGDGEFPTTQNLIDNGQLPPVETWQPLRAQPR